MTMNRARFGLLGIFIFFMIVELVALSVVYQKMWPDEFHALMLKVLAIYSVHLTVILGAIFAQSRTQLKNAPPELAWTAILLTLLWNLPLAWRVLSFSMATQDSVQNVLKFCESISSASSFLLAGTLTFFFTKSSGAQQSAKAHASESK